MGPDDMPYLPVAPETRRGTLTAQAHRTLTRPSHDAATLPASRQKVAATDVIQVIDGVLLP